ncbi:hypothetical protein BU24DRAFT_400131 [Aaosphaeria arxii CBS 175.79]|uniref:Integral membrane protein n=1 Tax=Aaosphaeria arxii CBS 175.79 TaxID=1450172 RepID=A0A6A5XCD8_9PLEO|nr:uncharacterized protein BU24DRAFT_400131 [Aaosphaeria arxii CBS 175.79]KAF2010638.1 hypothetical protein BU24DRAFT_400131 [Aaosphaeria arxii CBS 175.79]
MVESQDLSSPLDIPTICFGFTLGFLVHTGSKVGKQSISIYKRTHAIKNTYLILIWAELLSSLAWAIVAWLFLRGDIKGSFGLFFVIVTLWSLQTQCILQIIANRVALVMTNKRHARILKLSLLVAVGIINISVYVIWIPARMEISPTWIHINEIWDRIEKVIYLLMDLCLNVYFLWLVRSKLISRGLTKYQPLFKFNAGIAIISISMDALIIGMMSLPDGLVYTQFHSLAYIVKLHIELTMSDLISKVVRGKDRTDKPLSSSGREGNSYPSKSGGTGGTELTTTLRNRTLVSNGNMQRHSHVHDGTVFGYTADAKGVGHTGPWSPSSAKPKGGENSDASSDSSSDSGINFRVDQSGMNGIMKTVAVETRVVDEWGVNDGHARAESRQEAGDTINRIGSTRNERRESTSSSTAQLNEYIPQAAGDRV